MPHEVLDDLLYELLQQCACDGVTENGTGVAVGAAAAWHVSLLAVALGLGLALFLALTMYLALFLALVRPSVVLMLKISRGGVFENVQGDTPGCFTCASGRGRRRCVWLLCPTWLHSRGS